MKNIIINLFLVSNLIIKMIASIFSSNTTINNNNNYNNSDYNYVIDHHIEEFNAQFLNFDGVQTGIQVKALIGRLMANEKNHEEDSLLVPTITFVGVNEVNDEPISYDIESEMKDSIENYHISLSNARSKIQAKHNYYVEFEYAEKGIINSVIIYYDSDAILTKDSLKE